MNMASIVDKYLTVILVILAIMILVCLVKAVIGPRVGDRLVCINMMGTVVIVVISILAIKIHEGYLVDISVIYAMLSFLAVIVLTKLYIGVKKESDLTDKEKEGEA